jgi:hypothetical protein
MCCADLSTTLVVPPPPPNPSPSSLHCPYTPRSSSSSWGVGKVVFADMSQVSSLRRRRLLHRGREQDALHGGRWTSTTTRWRRSNGAQRGGARARCISSSNLPQATPDRRCLETPGGESSLHEVLSVVAVGGHGRRAVQPRRVFGFLPSDPGCVEDKSIPNKHRHVWWTHIGGALVKHHLHGNFTTLLFISASSLGIRGLGWRSGAGAR